MEKNVKRMRMGDDGERFVIIESKWWELVVMGQ